MNNKVSGKLTKTNIILCVCFFLIYSYVGFCIPYYDDDWIAGGPYGWSITFFATANGRYVGNIIIDLLVRSRIFKTLFMGTVSWLIPYELTVIGSDLNSIEFRYKYIFFNILTMIIDTQMWNEVYGWVAGFGIYATVGIMLIFYIRIHRDILAWKENVLEKKSLYYYLGIFLFILAFQLMLENITICIFFISSICLFISIKKRINQRKHIVIFIGSVIGVFVMFNNSMMKLLFIDGQSVDDRMLTVSVSDSLVNKLLKILYTFISDTWFNVWNRDFYYLMIIIALLTIDIIVLKRFSYTNRVYIISFLFSLILSFILYSIQLSLEAFRLLNPISEAVVIISLVLFIFIGIFLGRRNVLKGFGLKKCSIVFVIFFWAVISAFFSFSAGLMYFLFSAVLLFWGKNVLDSNKINMLSIVILIIFLTTCPLAIVSERSPRLIYHGVLMEMVIISVLINYYISNNELKSFVMAHINKKNNTLIRIKSGVIIFAVAVAMSILIPVTSECKVSYEREKAIQEVKNNKSKKLVLPSYPIDFRLYELGNTFHGRNVYNFYKYYDIDYDVALYVDDEEMYDGDESKLNKSLY